MAISTGKVVALIQAMGSSADPAVIESAEHDQLDNMESEIQLDHKIRITDTTNIKINMKDLCALEELVDFEGLEDGQHEGCTC